MLTTHDAAGLVPAAHINIIDKGNKIMNIKILKTTIASGKRVVCGGVYDVSKEDGALLIKMKKAREATEYDKHSPEEQQTSASSVSEAATPSAELNEERVEQCIEAIDELEDDDFTASGAPKIKPLIELVGEGVTIAERNEAWVRFNAK